MGDDWALSVRSEEIVRIGVGKMSGLCELVQGKLVECAHWCRLCKLCGLCVLV